ncbi:hypothetical protein KW791_00605 [Candidatus Parcubacteria bacterium]|nr:hypothetical protein [Candidatus Parcubacteria bacterium]
MTIQTNAWHPDTCGCAFEYTWDDQDLDRVRTLNKVIHVCDLHKIISLTPSSHYSTVSDENVRKNKLYGRFLGVSDLTQTDASGNVNFKNGVDVSFSWDGTDYARILSASITGYNLSGANKNSVQDWCDSTFGFGKVAIN